MENLGNVEVAGCCWAPGGDGGVISSLGPEVGNACGVLPTAVGSVVVPRDAGFLAGGAGNASSVPFAEVKGVEVSGRCPYTGIGQVFGVTSWGVRLFRFASRRFRCPASRASSWVSKSTQMLLAKCRKVAPVLEVTSSKISRVGSVWEQSFASPCQWAHKKSNFNIEELYGSGKSPSNTAMAHCISIN